MGLRKVTAVGAATPLSQYLLVLTSATRVQFDNVSEEFQVNWQRKQEHGRCLKSAVAVKTRIRRLARRENTNDKPHRFCEPVR